MNDVDRTLSEYRRISGTVRELVSAATGLDLARVRTKLPPSMPAIVRMLVTLPLGARFELMIAHDQRHVWQAAHVRHDADFPK